MKRKKQRFVASVVPVTEERFLHWLLEVGRREYRQAVDCSRPTADYLEEAVRDMLAGNQPHPFGTAESFFEQLGQSLHDALLNHPASQEAVERSILRNPRQGLSQNLTEACGSG